MASNTAEYRRLANSRAIPKTIKCSTCHKIKEPQEYSTKQLQSIRSDRTHKPQCSVCTPQQVLELPCYICSVVKDIYEYSNAQRKNHDTAKCKVCMEEQLRETRDDDPLNLDYDYDDDDDDEDEMGTVGGVSLGSGSQPRSTAGYVEQPRLGPLSQPTPSSRSSVTGGWAKVRAAPSPAKQTMMPSPPSNPVAHEDDGDVTDHSL